MYFWLVSCRSTNSRIIPINDKISNTEYYLDKYDFAFKLKYNPDTIKLNQHSILIVKLFSIKGRIEFYEFNQYNRILLKGFYRDAETITYRTMETFNPENGTSIIDSFGYYIPIKVGIWEFYNNEGKIIKTENYRR